MIKLIVAVVLVIALLGGLSPWPGHAWVVFDGGAGMLAGLLGLVAAMAVTGLVIASIVGGALLLVLGIPILLVFGVLLAVAAPLLIPLLIVAALIGLVLKGLACTVLV